MTKRTFIAVAVLVLWAVGLAVLVSKEFFRPRYDQLAIAALRVNPSAVYFGVFQDSMQTGFASSIIDTSKTEIIASDNLVIDPPTTGASRRSLLRSKVILSRALRLKSFELIMEPPGSSLHVTGTVDGGTLVTIRTATGEKPDTARLPLAGPVFIPMLLPLVLALTEAPKLSLNYTLPLFDPVGKTLGDANYRVTAESLFVLNDSAVFDPSTKRWRATLPDTVRAWQIIPLSGPSFIGWVNAQGQLVQTKRMGGELKRLPYEVAFTNWKAELDKRDSARVKR